MEKGIDIVKETYVIAKKMPPDEKFALVSQMTRAAVSIPANITEGSSRNSGKDYARFMQIALGSAFEPQTYFVIIKEMNLVEESITSSINLLLEEEIKMIHGFRTSLTKQLTNG